MLQMKVVYQDVDQVALLSISYTKPNTSIVLRVPVK